MTAPTPPADRRGPDATTGEFRMPSLGADMEYATLVAWRVRPGDRVARGDVMAEVETQKGVVEAEVFEAGVVEELLAEVGARVPVGGLMARIAHADGAAPAAAAPAAAAPAAVPAVVSRAAGGGGAAGLAVVAPAAVLPPGDGSAVRASPAARRLAAARRIDLARLGGSGPGGAVTLADVERATPPDHAIVPAAEVAPAAEAATRPVMEPAAVAHAHTATPVARRMAEQLGVDLAAVAGTGTAGVIMKADVLRAVTPAGAAPPPAPATPPASRAAAVRQAIAAAMSRSNREIPHYYLATDVEVSAATAWLERTNAERPVTERLLPAAVYLKAVALALRETPELNGAWTDGAFHPAPAIHLGVAIALRGGGLIAPALHDADTLPLVDLMRALRDLVQRARTAMLRSSEMSDATVTVTHLGDLGVQTVFGVIYPPQVALVGIGRVSERPWAQDGLVGARPVVTVTLAADHRASDGHTGARFLTAFARLLQAPERL
jgi:pyruvate dehydrogenase E2 component (dihydrolipoamide acetyltransferase)